MTSFEVDLTEASYDVDISTTTLNVNIAGAYGNADFRPNTDDIYDLGVSSYRWKDCYVAGTLYMGGNDSNPGVIDDGSGTGNIKVSAHILPDTNSTYTLGSYDDSLNFLSVSAHALNISNSGDDKFFQISADTNSINITGGPVEWDVATGIQLSGTSQNTTTAMLRVKDYKAGSNVSVLGTFDRGSTQVFKIQDDPNNNKLILTTARTCFCIDDELSLNSNKIIDVTDPTADQDAATKKYVDDTAGWNYTATQDFAMAGYGLTSTGEIAIKPSGYTDDYMAFATESQLPKVKVYGYPYMVLESDQTSSGIRARASDGDFLVVAYDGSDDIGILRSNKEIVICPNSDNDDYIQFKTTSDVPEISAQGSCDLKLTATGSNITFTDATAGSINLSAIPEISSGSGAPSSTPSNAGDIYVDTTGGNIYISKAATGSGDWIQVNN